MLVVTGVRAEPSTTSVEQGYDLGEIQSPRGVAMAGALNALGVSTAALYQNPANLPFAHVYHLELIGAISPEASRQSYGGAVVDSVLNRQGIAGGLGGTWSMLDPDGIRRSWTDVRVAMAFTLGERIAFGATGRYLRIEQAVASGPLGQSLASDGTKDKPLFNGITFDAGMTVSITEGLRIGLVGHNLTNPGTGLAPTTLATGLGYTSRVFSIEGGGLFDFTTWNNKAKARVMVGAEAFLADRIALRAGYRYDDGLRIHAVSGGVGYMDRRWGIELGARRDVSGLHPATLLTVSLRYFHDALGGETDAAAF